MNRLRNGKATRQIVGPDGTRRTVPAWQAQPTPRKGGLSDWLAQRRHAPPSPCASPPFAPRRLTMGKYDELVSDLHQTDSGHPECDQRIRKAATAITTIEAELAAMKARGDRLAEIARHASLCNFITGLGDGLCDCGLDQVLAEWRDQ